MSKATHNGTCQACGRVQAVNNTTGRLAKHGYTVDYGYFSGTCSGSDKLPLEKETSHNVAAVAAIREWADDQDRKAAGELTKVSVKIRERLDTGFRFQAVEKNVVVDLAEWLELNEAKIEKAVSEHTDRAYWVGYYTRQFEDKIDSLRSAMIRNAKSARVDADLLEQLRDKTFGNALTSRASELELHRERFSTLRDAYDRQAELKEQGIKSTVRGGTYRQREITLTYRK